MSNQLGTVEPRYVVKPALTEVEDNTLQAVTVAQAKKWARQDEDFDDDDFEMLINACQTRGFEAFTNTLLFQREVTEVYYPEQYRNKIKPSWVPLVSVTSITDEDGNTLTEDDDYEVQGDEILVDLQEKVTVVYQAGHFETVDDVKDDVKLGMKKWIATNYDDREDTSFDRIYRVPNESREMWMNYKEYTI